MKARYLTFYSYIGTGFRSSEKLWLKEGRNYPDPMSIQGVLELALLKLKSLNYPNIVLSSRTDGGVHALNASAHFDLERFGNRIYNPEEITYSVNKFLYKYESSIFMRKCIRVPNHFNARRYAKSRKYLYRIAILKPDISLPEKTSISSFIPIEEWKRCTFLRLENFNIERFKEGSKYFIGYHDFTSFKKQDKFDLYKHNRRELLSFDVEPGAPLVTSNTRAKDDVFEYYDVKIEGKAFVHNQIRRMLGTLLSVGIGKLEPADIKVMLQVPSKHSWHSSIQSLGPDGLYLSDVVYDPKDLEYVEETESDVEKDCS